MRRLMQLGIITADQLKSDFNGTAGNITAENSSRNVPTSTVRLCIIMNCLHRRRLSVGDGG